MLKKAINCFGQAALKESELFFSALLQVQEMSFLLAEL